MQVKAILTKRCIQKGHQGGGIPHTGNPKITTRNTRIIIKKQLQTTVKRRTPSNTPVKHKKKKKRFSCRVSWQSESSKTSIFPGVSIFPKNLKRKWSPTVRDVQDKATSPIEKLKRDFTKASVSDAATSPTIDYSGYKCAHENEKQTQLKPRTNRDRDYESRVYRDQTLKREFQFSSYRRYVVGKRSSSLDRWDVFIDERFPREFNHPPAASVPRNLLSRHTTAHAENLTRSRNVQSGKKPLSLELLSPDECDI